MRRIRKYPIILGIEKISFLLNRFILDFLSFIISRSFPQKAVRLHNNSTVCWRLYSEAFYSTLMFTVPTVRFPLPSTGYHLLFGCCILHMSCLRKFNVVTMRFSFHRFLATEHDITLLFRKHQIAGN